ncbi:MAG: LamB/YcsF family protein [Nitrospirae bacterium]|nr:LamB/YcsF family protein [Nitrospirota bacterium]
MLIDLNSDLGEAADAEQERLESLIFPFVSSVNVACGEHAGNPDLMRRTVQRAREHGLSVGAHPGFPDREHKGRRDLGLTLAQIETLVASQIGSLARIAALEQVTLTHVKPHGALYGRSARERSVAEAIVRAVRAVDPHLIIVGLASSPLIQAARDAGLGAAEEAFVDRAYEHDGLLVSREIAGSVMMNEEDVLRRVEQLVRDKVVVARTGVRFTVRLDTVCVHSDTPGADRLVALIRSRLESLGVTVAPLQRRSGV